MNRVQRFGRGGEEGDQGSDKKKCDVERNAVWERGEGGSEPDTPPPKKTSFMGQRSNAGKALR